MNIDNKYCSILISIFKETSEINVLLKCNSACEYFLHRQWIEEHAVLSFTIMMDYTVAPLMDGSTLRNFYTHTCVYTFFPSA